tara:strand:+ start:1029 stop:1418 length:390 start_codon:yes stop_codon:yes gene_type:complete
MSRITVRSIVLRAAADFTASTQTSSFKLDGLPAGTIDPAKIISFWVASDTPSGTSPTLDITIQSSWNDSDWHDEGAGETQLSAAAANLYTPTIISKYYRLDLVIGGSDTPTFGNLVCVAMVVTDGYSNV